MRQFLILLILIIYSFEGNSQEYVKVQEIGSKKYFFLLIEDGFSLESLAKDFSTTVDSIIASNPGIERDFSVGQKIMIPAKMQDVLHEVKQSETLYSLCRKYSVSMDSFKNDSTIINGKINIGQILTFKNGVQPILYSKIRKSETQNQNATNNNDTTSYNDSIIEYKVNQGETLYSISRRYMTSSEKIQKLNNITPVQLKSGMILKIPLKKEQDPSNIKIKTVDSLGSIAKIDSTLLFPVRKGPWKIAVFLPFYLGNSKKAPAGVVSNVTEIYMGAKMAIDELGSTELYVYDYMTDTVDISKILNRPEFKTMDLIFAPIDEAEALIVANWCQAYNVPFVTIVPKATRFISNNPMAHFAVPSDVYMLKTLAKYAIKTYPTKQIILVKSNSKVDISHYEAFKSVYYSEHNPTNIKLIEATTKDFGQYLQKNPSSIVVFASNEKTEVTDFMNLLKPYSGVTLFGHKDWLKFGSEVTSVTSKFKFHYVNYQTPIPFDYNTPSVKSLHRKYREYYNADITGMTIYGYDVFKYFTSYILLKNPSNGALMDFDVKPNFDTGGFENVNCFVTR